jgi:hypothetical protein
MTTRPRGLRDDTGAMLIVAMIIVTTVAVVTGAVLSHGWTNFRATVALRGVAGTSYAADAGAKLAINNLRLGSGATEWTTPSFPGSWDDWVFTDNADGTGCFGADGATPQNTLKLNNLYPKAGDQKSASSVRVECSAVPGTGIFSPGSGVNVVTPSPTGAFGRALTTVGTTGAWHGILLKPLGTGNQAAMPVRGGIGSRSFITVNNGALVTDGYVKADGACTGQIISNPARECNLGNGVTVPAAPTSPLTTVPTYRNPASALGCVFQPGYYNNAATLTAAVNACGIAKFASGKYYFDFIDENLGGQNVWNISTTVIGGEYLGGPIPGACKSPIDHPSVDGVQFVFGGTSRMTVDDSAHVALCGPSNSGQAPITLYQQQTGVPGTMQVVGPGPAQAVVQIANNKVDPFTIIPAGGTLQGALAAEDASSLAWVASKKDQRAEIDLGDFAGLSTIPVGAEITAAEVRIKYLKSPTAPSLTLDVADTPTAPAVTVPLPLPPSGWASVDLAAHMRLLIETSPLDANRPKLELRLPATDLAGTLAIDALTLKVTYTTPALRPAIDGPFVTTGANFKGEFVIEGATFAPNGYVAMAPGSADEALVAFRWGLVALGVDFKSQPSQDFGYPLVSLPDLGGGFGRRVTVVDLKVYVCIEQATCASGGKHSLTVRVMIADPPYTAWGSGSGLFPRPEPGRRRIEVLSWAKQD